MAARECSKMREEEVILKNPHFEKNSWLFKSLEVTTPDGEAVNREITTQMFSDEHPSWNSTLSPFPYEIVEKAKSSLCYGCGQKLSALHNRPPFNLVVKHVDRRIVMERKTGEVMCHPEFSPTYYHLVPSHIRRKNPYFDGYVMIKKRLYKKLKKYRHLIEGNGFHISTCY